MNDRPASGPRSPDPFPVLRVAALIAAILGVLVLAAAAFVLSYPGIHQLARTAGMSVTLARIFPVIFDALLVVAIAAVLSLHGAGWWRRGYSWLITLLLLAAMAAGGVLHALHPHIPHRTAAVTAAVLPWALLLIAFSLLLSMLRQFRHAHADAAAAQAAPSPASAEPRTGLDGLLSPGGPRIVPAQPSRAGSATAPAAPTPANSAPVPATPASQAAARPPRPSRSPGHSSRAHSSQPSPGPGHPRTGHRAHQHCPHHPPGAVPARRGPPPDRAARRQPTARPGHPGQRQAHRRRADGHQHAYRDWLGRR